MTDIAPFPARARAAGAQRPLYFFVCAFEPSAADPRRVAFAWPAGGEVA